MIKTFCILLILLQGLVNATILRNIDSKIDKIVIFLDINPEDGGEQ